MGGHACVRSGTGSATAHPLPLSCPARIMAGLDWVLDPLDRIMTGKVAGDMQYHRAILPSTDHVRSGEQGGPIVCTRQTTARVTMFDGWLHERRRRSGTHWTKNVTRNVTGQLPKDHEISVQGRNYVREIQSPPVCHCSRWRANQPLS